MGYIKKNLVFFKKNLGFLWITQNNQVIIFQPLKKWVKGSVGMYNVL